MGKQGLAKVPSAVDPGWFYAGKGEAADADIQAFEHQEFSACRKKRWRYHVSASGAFRSGLPLTETNIVPLGAARALETTSGNRSDAPLLVGGHVAKGPEEPPYLLRLGKRHLLKVVQSSVKGERETAFYHAVFTAPTHPVLEALRPFLPAFSGITELNGSRYLILENLCVGSDVHPSILDIKIGCTSAALDASPEKVQKEMAKYPHQQQLGFRVTGMKVYDTSTKSYDEYGNSYWRSLAMDDVPAALARFFLRGASRARVSVFMSRLEALLEWFESQRVVTFRASSLLFVDLHVDGVTPDVRMIDFAHTTVHMDAPQRDDGYICGLRSLLSILRRYVGGTEALLV